MLAGNAAEAAMAMGQWSRARDLVEWASRLSPPGNHWVHQRRLLASIRLWADDDIDAASEIIAEISRYSQLARTGPQYFAGLRRTEAELALAQGDPLRCWEILTATLDELPWPEIGYVLPALGVLAMAYGRLGADRLPGAGDWLREKLIFTPSLPVTRQWSAYIDAELDGSADAWATAITRMQDAAAPQHMTAYAMLRSAAALLSEQRTAEAARAVADVRIRSDRMGLRLLHRWIDDLERESGLTGDVPAAAVPLLTPREREVVALIAEGLSNRQIGQRLVISTKTASVHVSNILAKLNVTGRAEAAVWFNQQNF
jgi:DNA-binding CsgD family transcriptional regulator